MKKRTPRSKRDLIFGGYTIKELERDEANVKYTRSDGVPKIPPMSIPAYILRHIHRLPDHRVGDELGLSEHWARKLLAHAENAAKFIRGVEKLAPDAVISADRLQPHVFKVDLAPILALFEDMKRRSPHYQKKLKRTSQHEIQNREARP